MYKLIDSHSHLEEVESLELAIERAKHSGIVAIVTVGSDYEYRKRFEILWATQMIQRIIGKVSGE